MFEFRIKSGMYTDLKDNEVTFLSVDQTTFCLFLMVAAFTGERRLSAIICYLDSLYKVNIELTEYHPLRKRGRSTWWVLISFLVYTLYVEVFLCTVRFYYAYGILALPNIIHDSEFILQHTLQFLFCLTTLEGYSTLKHLNQCLEDLLGPHHEGTRLMPGRVDRLAVMYTSICEALRRLDQSHGLLLLLCVFSILLHQLHTLYQIARIITLSLHEHLILGELLIYLLWFVHDLVGLLLLVEPSHRTLVEFERTRRLVSRLTRSLTKDPIGQECDLFYRQLMLNRVSYSPLKLFTLDRQLLVALENDYKITVCNKHTALYVCSDTLSDKTNIRVNAGIQTNRDRLEANPKYV